jgi:coatomer protein complex subunit alpha (xenin)
LITEAREYLLGVSIELQRRAIEQEDPENVQRSLELAHYFAHCQMQPRHLQLALRNAMLINKKANNHASAANYARRLLELNPDPSVAQKVRSLLYA